MNGFCFSSCWRWALEGLAWTWPAAPARPSDTTPAALNAVDRAIYLRLVADSFAADGNEGRAAARLDALGSDAAAQLVTLLTEELRDGRGGRGILNGCLGWRAETFFTGFAGAGGRGEADFDINAEVNYSVAIGEDAPAASNLAIQVCPNGQDGGWQLAFRERAP